MPKNKIFFLLLSSAFLCFLQTQTIFAQGVTDNSKQQQVNAAMDKQEQAAPTNSEIVAPPASTNSEAQAPASQPAAAPLQLNQPSSTVVPSQPAPEIVKAIDIQGNKSIGVAQILARIKTRVGEPYKEEIISDDLKRLYNTGYFSDVQIDHQDYEGGYRVIVKVKEKPIVDEVTFSKIRYFNKKFLQSKIKTQKDKFLDNKNLKDDVNTIEDLYKKKGLSQVKVDVETFLDKDTNRISVEFIIREGYRVKIKHIYIYGNTAYSDKRIIKVMKSRPTWLFNSGLLKEDVLDEDMGRIQSFYEQNGYLDAKTTYQVERLYKGLVNVNVTVDEGHRYYVGDVSFNGNAVLSDYDIRSDLKNLKGGNVFSHEKLDQDMGNIRDAYFDRGYISADIQPSTSFNTQTGRVDVKIDIKEGQLAYINEIKIQGNTHTRDIVIRRELRVYPGDQFNGEKLRQSKQRLKDLGYFEDVGYDIEDTPQPDQKNLVVQVKEAKTGSFSFGGGYSTVDKLVGFIEVEQKNFDISNWPSFTGGGQDLRIRGEVGSTQRNALLSFTDPWLFDYPVSGGFDLYLTENLKDSSTGYAYDDKRKGFDVRLGKSFNDHFSIGSVYRLEQITIGNLDPDVSADLLAEEGSNWVSSLGFSTTHDYRDSTLNPTKGLIMTNSLDVAGGPLGGDKDFYRLQTNDAYYIPLKFNQLTTVLEISARTGVVKAYDDTQRVPIFERYFAGGAQSIRGYDERAVGPHDPNTNDPIGGEALLVGSVEYTVPIIAILKAAIFFDTGNVWAKAKDYGTGGLKSGTGVGLRVKTPIGPINLDYGFPLNSEQGEDKKGKFYFSVSRGF